MARVVNVTQAAPRPQRKPPRISPGRRDLSEGGEALRVGLTAQEGRDLERIVGRAVGEQRRRFGRFHGAGARLGLAGVREARLDRTRLRGLGVTSAQRNPLTPDLVPICETMPELKPFNVSTWFGVFLPAATPRPIVDAYNAQMKLWLDDAKTKERFTTMAGFPAYGTPEQFAAFVNQQIALWKGVIDKEGLKLDVN